MNADQHDTGKPDDLPEGDAKTGFRARVRRAWNRAADYYREHRIGITITLLIFLFFTVLFSPRIVIFVEDGEAAVLFRRFENGVVTDRTYGEGVHFIPPWDHMTIYNVRYQNYDDDFEVLSNDGLLITVKMEMRYRPVYDILPILHQQVGPDYVNKIVIPEVEAVVREIFGQYTPEEIYGSEQFIVENTIQNAIAEVSDRFVQLDDVLIKKVLLPEMVKASIDEKVKQKHRADEYVYRIIREEREAERKRIEAAGIRDFQNIITEGITPEYLRFKGIEATLELARSNNAKVVVIGSGPDGLPIILDGTSSAGTGGGASGLTSAEIMRQDSLFNAHFGNRDTTAQSGPSFGADGQTDSLGRNTTGASPAATQDSSGVRWFGIGME